MSDPRPPARKIVGVLWQTADGATEAEVSRDAARPGDPPLILRLSPEASARLGCAFELEVLGEVTGISRLPEERAH